MAADDLAPLLTGEPQRESKGQGVLVAWDPDTFENQVQFRGEKLVNVPVKSAVEALTFQPGDTVILEEWVSSRGGTASRWIDGKVVIPGTGRGAESIAFMTTTLGTAVARAVIGASVFFDSNPVNAIRDAFDTFGDLEALIGGAASPGPTVSFELSGTEILCLWGSQMQAGISDGTEVRAEGFTGIEISGPTATAPSVGTAQHLNLNYPNVSGLLGIIPSGSHGVKFTGMTPGFYTATLKFRIDDHGSSGLSNIVWNDRWLTVIAF